MKTLAVVGMPGSGKSVVTTYLESRGLHRIYFGNIVLQEVTARDLELNPDNERLVREDLRRRHGMAAMAVLSLPQIQAALRQRTVVIDGLYSFTEYKFLRTVLGHDLILLAVVCKRSLRYARLAQRPVRPLTPLEAEVRDLAEIEHIEKGGPIAMADYTIINDTTEEELIATVEQLWQTLRI